jgi:hypothetical protein
VTAMPDSPAVPDLTRDSRAWRVLKRPVVVAVRFAAEDGTCGTLEGPVRYRSGDALVTGTVGEQWPIARERFDETYERVAEGQYRKRPAVAYALCLQTAMRVPLGGEGDVLDAQQGDWLLQYDDGGYGIVDPDVFEQAYEVLSRSKF